MSQKERQKIFLVDVDGVLADFLGHLFNIIDASITPDQVTNWDMFNLLPEVERANAFKVLSQSSFWRTLPLLPHAQQSVEDLRRQGRVLFLTSPWSSDTEGWKCDGWGYARSHWLREHFAAKSSDCIFTYSKWFVRGDVFIDDRYTNIVKWQDYNPEGRAFLMRTKCNENDPWPRSVKIGNYGWEYYENG